MKRHLTDLLVAARAIAGLTLLVAAIACSTAPPKTTSTTIFFPPAPELPRIQYLTSFTGRKDIEEQSTFDKFVVGEKADLKVDKPYGVAVYDGKIYVCDANTGLIVFDLKDKKFGLMKGAVGPGALRQPINISIDAEGNKYVADPIRGQVLVFDRSDAYVRAYGTAGSWRPVDAVPFDGSLYVADSANAIVKVLDLRSGETVKTIGDKGEASERLNRPTNLAFDMEGNLYVTDVGRFQVVKFDRDGHFRSTVGEPGDNAGHFARPKGIAIDREGRLLAVDSSFANVQVFNKDGRLLMFFGGGGDKPGDMLLPAKVAIDYDNVKYFDKFVDRTFQVNYLIFVTGQFGPRRVNVFASGQERGRKYPTDTDLVQRVEERRKKESEKATPDKPAEKPTGVPALEPAAKQPGT